MYVSWKIAHFVRPYYKIASLYLLCHVYPSVAGLLSNHHSSSDNLHGMTESLMSIKRVSSSSSIVGLITGYSNVYNNIWKGLLQLAVDPSPKVASMARTILTSVQLKVSIVSYTVSCVLCSCVTIDTFLGFSLVGFLHLPCVICPMSELLYNLPVDLIEAQVLSGAILIISFYMCLLTSNVKSLQSIYLTL